MSIPISSVTLPNVNTELAQMPAKFRFGALMLLCFARSLSAQTVRTMSNNAGLYSVAYVTVPNVDVAKNISRGLVKDKLAACVNIIPQVTSIYEWKNEINEDNELLMMIKTRTDAVEALTDYVKKNHPYEVCEVIALPIQNGNEQYLNWIGEIVPSADKRQLSEG